MSGAWRRLHDHSPAPVAVQPAGRRAPDIPRRVPGTGRDQQLLADPRAVNLARDLELHLALQHDDQLVRRVAEVFPWLARRIGPELATETTSPPQFLAICSRLTAGMFLAPRRADIMRAGLSLN